MTLEMRVPYTRSLQRITTGAPLAPLPTPAQREELYAVKSALAAEQRENARLRLHRLLLGTMAALLAVSTVAGWSIAIGSLR